MKKRIVILSISLVLLVAVAVGVVFALTYDGLKKINNEYLYTLDGTWEGAKDFSEGLAAVKKDGKWGFIDTEGTVVIQPIYHAANSFSEGLAAVQMNGRWGYVDTKGNVVIPFTLSSTYAFSEGLAVYGSGIYYGYIDKTGKAVTGAVYSEATAFHNGIACVKKDNRYAFINSECETVTEFIYGDAATLDEGMIPVFYGDSSKGINTGYIDKDGKQVLDFLWYDAREFCGGLAAACVEYTKPYGFINTKGEFVIAPTWDSVENFSHGFALVETQRQFTFINTDGNKITDKLYGKAYSFTADRLARVARSTGSGWSFGFINEKGEEVIALQYASASDFVNGVAAVGNGTKYGFINTDGTQIAGYYWTDVNPFTEDGIARVSNGDVYGFIKLK